jgi:membrane protein required for colicin V production
MVFALRCYIRGFVTEVMSTAALVGGVFSGVVFYRPAGEIIGKLTGLTSFLEVIGFVAAFLLVFAIIKVAETVVDHTIDAANLGTIDKVLGFFLGAAEGLLIVCVVLILIALQPMFNVKDLLDKSFIAKILLPLIVERGQILH